MKVLFSRQIIIPLILTAVGIGLTLSLPTVDPNVSNRIVIGLFLAIFGLYLLFTVLLNRKKKINHVISDIFTIILTLVILWELTTNRLELLTSFIYPTPAAVLQQFQMDASDLFSHFISSIRLLASGYFLAMLFAIPFGMISAWFGRLEKLMRPISSVLAPIPPIVLIPYAITVFPSFRASSTFIIFIGAFWPIFVASLNGVAGIDKRYIHSARTLGLSNFTLFRKIILPAALPSIFTGLSIAMILSFILLTAAEMIGANAGIGYYVKIATDFGNYARVVTGILFIGFIVTIVMTLFAQIERYLLRWR